MYGGEFNQPKIDDIILIKINIYSLISRICKAV